VTVLAGETSEVTLAARVACPAWLAGHGETCQLQNSRIARLFSFFGSACKAKGTSVRYRSRVDPGTRRIRESVTPQAASQPEGSPNSRSETVVWRRRPER
jgi:hypothetical protein